MDETAARPVGEKDSIQTIKLTNISATDASIIDLILLPFIVCVASWLYHLTRRNDERDKDKYIKERNTWRPRLMTTYPKDIYKVSISQRGY